MRLPAGFWDIKNRKRYFYPACDYFATKKHFIKIGDAHFWVEIEGKGKPLILIHGGPGGNHCYFHPGMSVLAAKRKLIYYDLRGHYMSSGPRKKFFSAALQDAEDVELLRQTLSFENIDILGHSYGGIVAFLYALNYQQNLNKVIFCSPPVNISEKEITELLKHNRISIKLKQAKSYEKQTEFYYKLYFHKAVTFPNRHYNEMTRKSFCSYKNQKLLKAYENDNIEINWKRDLCKIKKQMLFIFGKHDPLSIIEKSCEIINELPNAKLKVLDKSGHDPFADEPQKFFRIVNGFLSRIT